jgi:hypothetical protein
MAGSGACQADYAEYQRDSLHHGRGLYQLTRMFRQTAAERDEDDREYWRRNDNGLDELGCYS